MRPELWVLIVAGFFAVNAYYDNKYLKILKSWKKYYQMAGIAFVGISSYAYIKKFPEKSHGFIHNANGFIKHLPIDSDAGDFLSPMLDLTKKSFFGPATNVDYKDTNQQIPPQQKRMMASGKNSNKRSVSETKKKYVASIQDWKCGNCKK